MGIVHRGQITTFSTVASGERLSDSWLISVFHGIKIPPLGTLCKLPRLLGGTHLDRIRPRNDQSYLNLFSRRKHHGLG
ncbi:MAG: hypothetical protein ACJAVK_000960 [Akkermansiaceae bacterium]|jgi:hypothetical protein